MDGGDIAVEAVRRALIIGVNSHCLNLQSKLIGVIYGIIQGGSMVTTGDIQLGDFLTGPLDEAVGSRHEDHLGEAAEEGGAAPIPREVTSENGANPGELILKSILASYHSFGVTLYSTICCVGQSRQV